MVKTKTSQPRRFKTTTSLWRPLPAPGRAESAERRLTNLLQHARLNVKRVIARAGLTPIYLWLATSSVRIGALCISAKGGFFTVEVNCAQPVSISESWAFALDCQRWAESRELEDGVAVARWEAAILKQLQRKNQIAGFSD